MVPSPEELEKIRAEFAAIPNVLGAEIEVIPASVRIRAFIDDMSFGKARPIYHKEQEFFERFPELRLDVQVEVTESYSEECEAEGGSQGRADEEVEADKLFQMHVLNLLEEHSAQHLADCWMVGKHLVELWAEGKNLPHPALRHGLIGHNKVPCGYKMCALCYPIGGC